MEDHIAPEDPVRAYDAFVEALDFRVLGIILDSHKIGNSEYYTKAMLKLLIYGYSYGIRSSRKLSSMSSQSLLYLAYLWPKATP